LPQPCPSEEGLEVLLITPGAFPPSCFPYGAPPFFLRGAAHAGLLETILVWARAPAVLLTLTHGLLFPCLCVRRQRRRTRVEKRGSPSVPLLAENRERLTLPFFILVIALDHPIVQEVP
jgi:hypothetical protein